MGISLDLPGLRVIEPVSNIFSRTEDYYTYRLIYNSSRYDAYVNNELHRMTKKTAVQMNNCAFSGKRPRELLRFYKNETQYVMHIISLRVRDVPFQAVPNGP